jgi:DNA-directed RNA polymerase subunit RPC12/RpoP
MDILSETVRCKDCKRPFILKDTPEYILSYCDGCNKLIVLYKINSAILAKNDKGAFFISSGPTGKCRKCGENMTVRNNKDYISIRCIKCAFAIVYKMPSHRGVARFISGGDFNKEKYWLSGKRQSDRLKKDAELKGK